MIGSIKWFLFSLICLGCSILFYAVVCVKLYIKHNYYMNDLIVGIVCFIISVILIVCSIQGWRNLNKEISRERIYDNSDMD